MGRWVGWWKRALRLGWGWDGYGIKVSLYLSLLECCLRGSGMRDDFAVSLEAADDGAESGDRLNEGLTELNPHFRVKMQINVIRSVL